MPNRSTAPPPTLREIILSVLKRERPRREAAYRRACMMASIADTAKYPGNSLTLEQREILNSVGREKLSLTSVLGIERLEGAVASQYEAALLEVIDDENKSFRRSLSAETAYLVMLKAYCRFTVRHVPERQHLSDEWAYNDCREFSGGAFFEFFEWLETGKGKPDHWRTEEFQILESRPHVASELLALLWKECPEECKALQLFALPEHLKIVPTSRAVKLFNVSRNTIRKYVKTGDLTDHRKPDAKYNSTFLLDIDELSRFFDRLPS